MKTCFWMFLAGCHATCPFSQISAYWPLQYTIGLCSHTMSLSCVFITQSKKISEQPCSKTTILPKAITQAIFDVAHGFINDTPPLTQFGDEVSLDSFCPDGFVGIGVPIGTETFLNQFVSKTYRDIIEDVEDLDDIQDGFIHYQIIRFVKPLDWNIVIRI